MIAFLLKLLSLFTHHRAPVVGHVQIVPNRERKHNAEPVYYRVPIVGINGGRAFLLLTMSDMIRGLDRARKNPEDCPLPRNFVTRELWPVARRNRPLAYCPPPSPPSPPQVGESGSSGS